MKKRLSALAALVILPVTASAAGGDAHLEDFEVYIDNKSSLQRGASYFVNHCMGCHSARYLRYNRLAEDLELSAPQVEENLIFTDQKIGDTMTNALRAEDGKKWFGKAPPDLTLVARARGEAWLYSYLHSFYLDESRPFGVNNLTYKDVNMPHVLGELQGWQRPVYAKARGDQEPVIKRLELVEPGLLTPEKYDRMVRDIVTFLSYAAEPTQVKRARVGTWVMLFLVVLMVLSYLLKREYWKDVH